MATQSIEERVAALEQAVENLRRNTDGDQDNRPWWIKRWGWAKDDPHYDEAMRLGREYRELLRPRVDPDP